MARRQDSDESAILLPSSIYIACGVAMVWVRVAMAFSHGERRLSPIQKLRAWQRPDDIESRSMKHDIARSFWVSAASFASLSLKSRLFCSYNNGNAACTAGVDKQADDQVVNCVK